MILHNSVLTRRHRHINFSASAPLNATEKLVKVSHHGVVIVGPELLFSIYRCCFLEFFVRGRDAKRLRAEVTVAQSTDLQDRRWRHLECSMEFFYRIRNPTIAAGQGYVYCNRAKPGNPTSLSISIRTTGKNIINKLSHQDIMTLMYNIRIRSSQSRVDELSTQYTSNLA